MSAPPGERERPGLATEALEESTGDADKPIVIDQSPLAQMKRRREAALRLPPLASGMRDPHFDLYPRDGAA